MISGIGFLGAGTILAGKHRQVAGLSTAALADVTVSWYNFGDAFSSYVRDYASAKFEALGIPFVNKDSNNIQQTQNDDL